MDEQRHSALGRHLLSSPPSMRSVPSFRSHLPPLWTRENGYAIMKLAADGMAERRFLMEKILIHGC